MRRTSESRSGTTPKMKWAILAATLLVAAQALAQEKQASRARHSAEAVEPPAHRIVVSIPDRRLALVEAGRAVKTYPVAVGADVSPSPTGQFKIAHRIPQPTYYAPGIVIPPGKENPLGTRWLGLSLKGFGIHGTNEPRSIGRWASRGCIRMRNRDIEELFELVRAADVVEVHAERSVELAQIFGAPDAPAPAASAPVVVAGLGLPAASTAGAR